RPGRGEPETTPALQLPGRDPVGQFCGRLPEAPGNGRVRPGGLPKISQCPRAGPERASLLPGWSVRRLWILGQALSVMVAVTDAGLGHRVVLVGLLIVGPCCVLLTGLWLPTGLTGLWVIGLAAVLGLPDGIWGTGAHLVFLGAVAAVALASTAAAAFIEIRGPSPPC
ncbi:MAG TPA: hypothetical protein VMK13_14625, partial [Streptosporangiaceae bacterium]|nr:hypothetical protein [Streptosporangiaceae bacterium]